MRNKDGQQDTEDGEELYITIGAAGTIVVLVSVVSVICCWRLSKMAEENKQMVVRLATDLKKRGVLDLADVDEEEEEETSFNKY